VGQVSVKLGFGMKFTVSIVPMGKPRMTRSDKWRKRPAVLRYFAYRAELILKSPVRLIPVEPGSVTIMAYLPIPESWSIKKKTAMAGMYHRQKPDCDNILKGVVDILWPKGDQMISFKMITKKWDDGNGARLEIEVE
jgi:Holliday junction resolvase RusA-like endonuclease